MTMKTTNAKTLARETMRGMGTTQIPKTPDPTIPDLEKKAKEQYDELCGQERKTAEHYWRLGKVLNTLRDVQGLGNGDWQKYLKTLHIDYNRAKRACRIADKHSKPEDLRQKTIDMACGYNPSPKVKAAKRAQAAAKAARKGEKVETTTDTPTEQPTLTDHEKAAWVAYLTACGTVQRAKWVMETLTRA